MRRIAVTRVDGRWHDLPDVGGMVSGDAPQGLCPACLMAVALDDEAADPFSDGGDIEARPESSQMRAETTADEIIPRSPSASAHTLGGDQNDKTPGNEAAPVFLQPRPPDSKDSLPVQGKPSSQCVSLRPQATPDGSGRPNVTSSLGSCWFLSEHVQTVAQFLEDRAHRSELGPVVDLAWIVALIEELLAPIAVVANVDEAAFGQ
jgi:hypothetical protein